MLNTIIHGNSLDVLKTINSDSIDCVVTSPPYFNLRDYQTASWQGGDAECKHIKTINSNKSTLEGGKTTQEKANFYKDTCNKCGAIRIDEQIGLEKTFNEYIDKLVNGIFNEVWRILKDTGSAWINLGDTYNNDSSYSAKGRQGFGNDKINTIKKTYKTIKKKSLIGIPDRFKIAMIDKGWCCRNEIVWHKPTCMPSSAKDRFTVDHEKIYFFVKNADEYFFKQQLEDATTEMKASTSPKLHSIGITSSPLHSIERRYTEPDKRNKRTVWSVTFEPTNVDHFAAYPTALINPMIDSSCPKGGTVLDPFFGTGTTGVVALNLDCNFIGIELNKDYIKTAYKRLKPILNQTKLFRDTQ